MSGKGGFGEESSKKRPRGGALFAAADFRRGKTYNRGEARYLSYLLYTPAQRFLSEASLRYVPSTTSP